MVASWNFLCQQRVMHIILIYIRLFVMSVHSKYDI